MIGAWLVIIPMLEPFKQSQLGAAAFSVQNLVAIYGLTLLGMAPYVKYVYHNRLEWGAGIGSISSFGELFEIVRSLV